MEIFFPASTLPFFASMVRNLIHYKYFYYYYFTVIITFTLQMERKLTFYFYLVKFHINTQLHIV